MNVIFSDRVNRGGCTYDCSGVWTRGATGIAWKVVVRHTDVVCRPSGVIDDGLSDDEVRDVICQLVCDSISEAVSARLTRVQPLL